MWYFWRLKSDRHLQMCFQCSIIMFHMWLFWHVVKRSFPFWRRDEDASPSKTLSHMWLKRPGCSCKHNLFPPPFLHFYSVSLLFLWHHQAVFHSSHILTLSLPLNQHRVADSNTHTITVCLMSATEVTVWLSYPPATPWCPPPLAPITVTPALPATLNPALLGSSCRHFTMTVVQALVTCHTCGHVLRDLWLHFLGTGTRHHRGVKRLWCDWEVN